MKKTKRIISMILAVIMLSMTAIGVNAEELIVGFDDLLEAVGIIEHDHEEEELMPRMVGDECICGSAHNYDMRKLYQSGATCGLSWCDAALYTQRRVCLQCSAVEEEGKDSQEIITWCDDDHDQGKLDTYSYGAAG